MIRRPRFPRHACLLLAVLAAINVPARAEKAKPVEVRFAAQAVPANLPELVMAAAEVTSPPFKVPVNHLTPPLEAPGRKFWLQVPDNPRALANIALPEAGNAFVVLLVPGLKAMFEAVVIPARDGKFRPGDFYLHNVSSKAILAKVGTTQAVIAPRTGEVIRPKGAREGRFYDVALGVREGDASRVISTSRWPVAGQMRTYVFFFDDPARQDVGFRAIDEFVPPDPGN